MRQTVNIAVIGCGYWGPNLIRNFQSLGCCSVRMVCDPDDARRRRVEKLYPDITTVAEADAVWSDRDVDAVAIATPAHTHFPLAKAALVHGKHTLVEKPLATSSADCRELIHLARRAERALMVDHTFIYSPPVRAIKEIIDGGELGDLLHINTHRLNLGLFQNDINVTWDLAPHDLSMVLHFLGQRPLSVSCQGHAHIDPEIVDVTTMSLVFPDGKSAMIQSSWLDPVKVRRMAIVGSQKMVLYDDTETVEKVTVLDKRVEAAPSDRSKTGLQFVYHDGDRNVPRLDNLEPLQGVCRDFVEVVRSGRPPKLAGEDGLAVVEILEAAEASLVAGGNRIDLRDADTETSTSGRSPAHGALPLDRSHEFAIDHAVGASISQGA